LSATPRPCARRVLAEFDFGARNCGSARLDTERQRGGARELPSPDVAKVFEAGQSHVPTASCGYGPLFDLSGTTLIPCSIRDNRPSKGTQEHAAIHVTCLFMRAELARSGFFFLGGKKRFASGRLQRDAILLSVMGSPDVRQSDGRAAPIRLTSKVGMVRLRPDRGCDLEFLFAQVSVKGKRWSITTPN